MTSPYTPPKTPTTNSKKKTDLKSCPHCPRKFVRASFFKKHLARHEHQIGNCDSKVKKSIAEKSIAETPSSKNERSPRPRARRARQPSPGRIATKRMAEITEKGRRVSPRNSHESAPRSEERLRKLALVNQAKNQLSDGEFDSENKWTTSPELEINESFMDLTGMNEEVEEELLQMLLIRRSLRELQQLPEQQLAQQQLLQQQLAQQQLLQHPVSSFQYDPSTYPGMVGYQQFHHLMIPGFYPPSFRPDFFNATDTTNLL